MKKIMIFAVVAFMMVISQGAALACASKNCCCGNTSPNIADAKGTIDTCQSSKHARCPYCRWCIPCNPGLHDSCSIADTIGTILGGGGVMKPGN